MQLKYGYVKLYFILLMTGRIYYEQKEKNNKEDWKKAIEKMLKAGLTEKEINDLLESTLYEVLLDKLFIDNTDGNKKMQRDDLI